MKYNFDEIIDRTHTNSTKYDAGALYNKYLPEEYIPMWVADMDFACPQAMLDAMKARIDRRILGYGNYTSTLPQEYFDAIINWLKRRHNIDAKRENIAFATSLMNAVREAVGVMSHDGEGVMVHTPQYPWIYYPIYEYQRNVTELPLIETDGYYTIDFDAFEKEASKVENTLLIFCSPHNPSGRVWTEAELKRLAGICFENDVKIFVDEIHSDIVRKSADMISLTALYPGDPRIVTATSTSKTFNAAGNCHSYVITYDKKLKQLFDDCKYCPSPNPLSVAALIAAYNECEDWLDEVNLYIDDNIDYLEKYLRENLPKVKFRKPEGTYLCWMDMRAYGLSEDDLNKKISQAGLYLEYGSEFVGNGDGFARMNVACPRSTLKKACEILKRALED